MSSAKIAFYNNTHYKISVKNYNGIRPVRNRTGHRRKAAISEKALPDFGLGVFRRSHAVLGLEAFGEI